MRRRSSIRSVGADARPELEIAAAVAREKAMQFHVSSALRLIALAGDRVEPMRMLSIHLRLHWVTGPEAELLGTRVLAAMGESSPAESARRLGPVGGAAAEPDDDSLLHVVRRRLRGRVNMELRRQVELAVGAAQAGLVHIHVDHAVRFTRQLSSTHSVAEAAALYAGMVGMPVPLRPAFHLGLLNRLALEELPHVSLHIPPAVREERAPPPVPRLNRRQVI